MQKYDGGVIPRWIEANPNRQWCMRCGKNGHSAHQCEAPESKTLRAVAGPAAPRPEPLPIAGTYWVACWPAFPPNHPARVKPL